MIRSFVIAGSVCLASLGSAHAASLFIPAVSGTPDQYSAASLAGGANGCITDIKTGRMLVKPYTNALPPPYTNDCFMTFPVNLPVGTTIDGVEIAYRDDAGASGKSIVAVLMSNRLKPYMGPVPLGIASDDVVPTSQVLYKNMGALGVPILTGDTYWVQVSSHRVTEIDYVSVTYH